MVLRTVLARGHRPIGSPANLLRVFFFACQGRTSDFFQRIGFLSDLYGGVAEAYAKEKKDDGAGPGVRPLTAILMVLFAEHQPLSDAERMPCDLALELFETKLDERLSYLEGDGPRLARKEVAIAKEYPSVQDYINDLKSHRGEGPDVEYRHAEGGNRNPGGPQSVEGDSE